MLQKNPDAEKPEISTEELTGLVLRIEEAEAERKDLTDHIRALYSEGLFDEKALRILVRLRKQTPESERHTMDCLAEYRRIMKRD